MIREWRNRRFGMVPVGLVVDLLAIGDRSDVISRLIAFALRRLGTRGAVVVLAVETPGVIGRLLQASGFRRSVHLGPVVLRRLPRKGLMIAPTSRGDIGEMLHLTFLDCDAELTF
jgi:hypothetical protein